MTAHTERSASGILRHAGSLEASLTEANATILGLRPGEQGWQVLAWAPAAAAVPDGLVGAMSELEGGVLLVGPASAENAAALRGLLPWLLRGHRAFQGSYVLRSHPQPDNGVTHRTTSYAHVRIFSGATCVYSARYGR